MKRVTTFENAAQRHWLVALVALVAFSMSLAIGCQRSDLGPPRAQLAYGPTDKAAFERAELELLSELGDR